MSIIWTSLPSLINSAIQDEIDEFNLGAKTKTEAAATEFDRQAGTIDEAQAREIVNNGQFFDQSGNIQRQIVNLLPGNEIGLRTGVDKNTQDALRNSSGEQKLIQTQNKIWRININSIFVFCYLVIVC